jgi:hypothetical protein
MPATKKRKTSAKPKKTMTKTETKRQVKRQSSMSQEMQNAMMMLFAGGMIVLAYVLYVTYV